MLIGVRKRNCYCYLSLWVFRCLMWKLYDWSTAMTCIVFVCWELCLICVDLPFFQIFSLSNDRGHRGLYNNPQSCWGLHSNVGHCMIPVCAKCLCVCVCVCVWCAALSSVQWQACGVYWEACAVLQSKNCKMAVTVKGQCETIRIQSLPVLTVKIELHTFLISSSSGFMYRQTDVQTYTGTDTAKNTPT